MNESLLKAKFNTAMKIGDWLRASALKLNGAGVDSAHLDSLLLLEFVLKRERTYFLANPEIAINTGRLQQLNKLLKRRLAHEPMAYILKNIEFYGRNFYVDKRVLTPRPESETMIELLLDLAESQKLKAKSGLIVVDVGTGSGCLAITTKLEFPALSVVATDVSQQALTVARRNARKLGADIKILHGDLLEPLRNSVFGFRSSVILANLPYVPNQYKINRAAGHEPKEAIFDGVDGLDLYRQFFKQVSSLPYLPRYILTEALPPQHNLMVKIAKKAGYHLQKIDGLIQLYRDSG